MENEGRRRALKFFVTACVLSAMYYFVSENFMPLVEVDSGSREAIGITARIIAVAKKEKKVRIAIEAGFDELIRINKLLSDDVNRVNQGASAGPVKVSPEFFEVLQTGIDYCKLSKGEFDITIIDSKTSGYEKLILDINNRAVRFAAEGMRLDLGEIAKGYAIDKAVEEMKRKGATGGLLDAGGIIRCFGKYSHGSNWLIEISPQRPQRDNDVNDINEVGMVLKLRDYAAARKLSGVTIIAPKAVTAEVVASAVSAMGTQKGLELVDSLLGVEAIIVTEGKVIKSKGADNFIEDRIQKTENGK